MGSHNGPRVVPGDYVLTFSTNEHGVGPAEVTAKVIADPRIEASDSDYAAQQSALDKIRMLVTDVHESVNQFRKVKSQLSGRLRLLNQMENQTELADSARTAMSEIRSDKG